MDVFVKGISIFSPGYLKFSLKHCILQFPRLLLLVFLNLRHSTNQNQSSSDAEMLLWYLVPGQTLHDLIDLHGLTSLTRSGFPWCTAARAILRQFCHGSRQRAALVHRVVCSESQDLKIDEGLSYNHNTRYFWGLKLCILAFCWKVFFSKSPSIF